MKRRKAACFQTFLSVMSRAQMVIQKEIVLRAKPRGFHLITRELLSLVPEIRSVKSGILHIFIKHTSASLTINENADPTVREDFESHFNKLAPEHAPSYAHDSEGPDDMPAHLKASLLGSSVSVPVTDGALNLGTWQGIYLCEHRDYSGSREFVVTLYGE